MLKSMTAYGRSTNSSPIGRVTVEIQSVNRKHMEVVASLPKELQCFEVDLRSWITPKVARGRVVVTVSVKFEGVSPVRAIPNLPLAKQLFQAWETIADELGNGVGKPSLESLMRTEGLIGYEVDLGDEERYKSVLSETVEAALEPFLAMKEREGALLATDIKQRLELVKSFAKEISGRAEGATEKYRNKLKQHFEEVLPAAIDNEDRILREIAIYADKVDITEELIRITSHLEQIDLLFKSGDRAIGKTLEFLIQELNREFNTIGAKASDSEVSHLVVRCKSEFERIREQIQNVE